MLSRYADRRGLRIWLVGIAFAFIVFGATGSMLVAILPFVASVFVARADQWLRQRRGARPPESQDSLDSPP